MERRTANKTLCIAAIFAASADFASLVGALTNVSGYFTHGSAVLDVVSYGAGFMHKSRND